MVYLPIIGDFLTDQIDRDSISRALRAFLARYRLEPIKSGPLILEGEYHQTFRMFTSGDELLQLQYRRQEHDHLVALLQNSYPNKLDRITVSNTILDTCQRWIENDCEISDDDAVREATDLLISAASESISSYHVLVPLQGLQIEVDKPFPLAGSVLWKNSSNSDMQLATNRLQDKVGKHEIYNVFIKAPSYLECKTTAQHKRAIDNAVVLSEQALDVLRLYVASFYFDRFREPSTQQHIGIAGTIEPGDRINALILNPTMPYTEQIPGSSFHKIHFMDYVLTEKAAQAISMCHLSRVNTLISGAQEKDKDHIARRLLRAVSWFAKATTASSIADAFLMFCIAIEGLLSEGRTSKEIYSSWLASLICKEEGVNISPLGGYLSSEFAANLSKASSLTSRFQIVNERCLQLFNYRNLIAHGSVMDEEVNASTLLDIETIARNGILAFVQGGWSCLNEFKNWFDQSTWVEFSPHSSLGAI